MGTLIGLVNMIANLGAVAFTLLFGWLKDTQGTFSGGFAALGALCLLSFWIGRRLLAVRSAAKG